ncbi:MAG: anaerobic ribonucleoside-triphosphate reductase activating protein [Candidatus Omnitrophica bacterium]|nr:anaerobic ribonucleoside-triphosphate reductase activating protein [Candidatus Omnitrophota bacterium]MCM8802923.1 anaerobic ribonucleoside-triphosphate reductase activating protein [Candidatus Omnitrophota bacterium]
MRIGALQKTSLIEFPGIISCIVFTQGCNFRCPYCHNPELVLPEKFQDLIPEDLFFSFLERRKKYLEGVCITGGEPTIQEDIIEFIRKIKDKGFKVKIDTNGSRPDIIEQLLNEKLIDYISFDLKGPIEKYKIITGVEIEPNKILKSIELIKSSKIDYEIRTTVVKKQILFEDFEKIGKIIEGCKKYFLQKFIPSKLVEEDFMKEGTYTDEEFEEIKKIMKKYVSFCEVR